MIPDDVVGVDLVTGAVVVSATAGAGGNEDAGVVVVGIGIDVGTGDVGAVAAAGVVASGFGGLAVLQAAAARTGRAAIKASPTLATWPAAPTGQ